MNSIRIIQINDGVRKKRILMYPGCKMPDQHFSPRVTNCSCGEEYETYEEKFNRYLVQTKDDYSWKTLKEFENMELAKIYFKEIILDSSNEILIEQYDFKESK